MKWNLTYFFKNESDFENAKDLEFIKEPKNIIEDIRALIKTVIRTISDTINK